MQYYQNGVLQHFSFFERLGNFEMTEWSNSLLLVLRGPGWFVGVPKQISACDISRQVFYGSCTGSEYYMSVQFCSAHPGQTKLETAHAKGFPKIYDIYVVTANNTIIRQVKEPVFFVSPWTFKIVNKPDLITTFFTNIVIPTDSKNQPVQQNRPNF